MNVNVLKWVANFVLCVGTIINSLGYYPLGPLILALGGSFWLIVSIKWKENSLIAINSFMVISTIVSVIYVTFFKSVL
jgi:hypothetical protein